MKGIFIIIFAAVTTEIACLNSKLPQLLIYEVSEKNGAPQVRLIKTASKLQPNNDDDDRNNRQSKNQYLYGNNRNDRLKPRYKSNQNYQLNRANNVEGYKNTDYGRLSQKYNYNDRTNYGNRDENSYAALLKTVKGLNKKAYLNRGYLPKRPQKDYIQQSERELIVKRIKDLLEQLQEIDNESNPLDNGDVYIGTMNGNEANSFLANLLDSSRKPRYESVLGRSKYSNILRNARPDELVDERTAPPPLKRVFVPDYYN